MSDRPPAVDVYLCPAVVGGGLGDIDEVLCAGHYLKRLGCSLALFRRPEHPLPPMVEGPWNWPPLDRTAQIRPRSDRAITIAPAWGVSCAPRRAEPLGRPGPWSEEVGDIEAAYGSDRTLHISLEEFARTLTSREETVERYREGGRSAREIRSLQRSARFAGEVNEYHDAFRRFRAFDRSNLLHLFATFRYAHGFHREYPESIQTGPLWPIPSRPRPTIPRSRGRTASPRWVWYASPSSSAVIVPALVAGLARARVPPQLYVRTPRAEYVGTSLPPTWHLLPAEDAATWYRRFRSADVRIVTGSRTLLEAIALGRPWLYFNGVLGIGARRRSHRPEKIRELLHVWPRARGSEVVSRDLRDFSQGRRVAEVVGRFMHLRGPAKGIFATRPRSPVAGPRSDLGTYLQDLARRWVATAQTAAGFVRSERSLSRV